MTFYLFLPLLFSKIKNLSHAILFFVITLIIYQINTILHNMPLIPESETWEIFLFLWFPTQLSAFSFGIMLFFLLDNRISSGRSNISWLIVLFSFVLLYFAIYAGMPAWMPYYLIFTMGFLGFSVALGLSPLIFVNRFIVLMGKLSYSCYLMHFGIIEFLQIIIYKKQLVSVAGVAPELLLLLLYVIVIFATIIAAKITYALIELPGIKLGNKVIGLLENKTADVTLPPKSMPFKS